jgi:hypothetical protein
MKPSGAHTHPELHGNGGNGWLIVLGALVLAAVAGPAVHAITDLIKALALALAVVLAIGGMAAVLLYRVRHRSTRRLTQRAVTVPQAPEPRALGRAQEVHLHFHAVSAEDVAAIIARYDGACRPPGSIPEALGEVRE